MQLSQAIGSGRLAGDEFRSVSEQIPGVLIPIAKEMGVTVGELKKLGSEGKITSDVLIRSLSGSFALNKEKIKQLLAEQPAAKFKAFSNAVSDLAVAVGDSLLPLILPLIELLTRLLKTMLRLPNPVKAVGGALIGLGLAFHAAAAGAAAFGKTLTASAVVGFMAMAAKIALVAAPLAGLVMVMEENIRKKQEFDEAMSSDEVGDVDQKIKEITTNIKQMEGALKGIESSGFVRGQSGEVASLKRQLEEAKKQLDLLTERKKLFIDVEFGIKGFDTMGTGFDEELTKELEKLGLKRNKKGVATNIKTKGTGGPSEAQQIEKIDANNSLRLTQKNAQIALRVARDEYALRTELEQSNHRLQESNLVGIARQQQAILNARIQAFRGLEVREQRLEDEVTKAEQRLAAAELRLTQATGPVDAARAQGTVSNAQADLSGAQQNLGNFRQATPTLVNNLSQSMSAQSTEPLRQQAEQTLIQVGALRQRNELLAQGVSPEVLEGEMAKFEIDRSTAVQLQQLNADRLTNATAIRDVKLAAEEAKGAIDQLTEAQQNGSNAIREYISTSMEFVSDVQGRIVEIASTIEQSIGSAIQGVVDGTLTASEAFGQFFANVGKSFLQMATQIIAKLIVIQLLKTAIGLFGGGGMPDGVGLGDGVNGKVANNLTGQKFGTLGPNFGIPQPYAKGGIVTGPTNALIGEGGMNEAVVPLPNGKAIPVDMRGASGGNVNSNVTVNVTNDGSSSDSDPNGPAKLGRAIDTAVRKVIMDERRSGGLLFSAR
jgi:tape measure domain-containing protein